MRNLIIYSFILVFYFWMSIETALGKSDGTVKITITIDGNIDIDWVNVIYCNDYYGFTYFWNKAPTIKAKVVNGNAQFAIPIDSAYGYVKFDFEGKSRRHTILKQLSECYFFTRKDGDVDILIKDTCIFNGSQPYEIQYETKSIRMSYDIAYRKAIDKMTDALNKLEVDSGAVYSEYLSKTRLIDGMLLESIQEFISNSNVLSELERAVLISNERYDLANRFLKNAMFHTSVGPYVYSEPIRRVILEDYLTVNDTEHDWCEGLAWKYSWTFIDYLYFKILADVGLPLQVADPRSRIQFSRIYEEIQSQEAGSIRDRLLIATFLNFSSTREIPNIFYERVSELIEDTQSDEFISNVASKRLTGVPGYPFYLPDTAGNVVSFAEFKGKVVVLDFWFTGCHGCRSLAKAMKNVDKYYRDNNEVVFVNVSVDKDSERWSESVRSGLYSHEGSISLYTGGRGTEDPIIEHYNITAYPTLIVFDRKGRVAYYNPRGPYNDTDRDLFINRIDRLL